MYLSGVRNVDESPGERAECICAEITVEDMRGGRLSEIYWLNLCECLQLEKSLLTYLTVHVIQQHSCFQIGSGAVIGPR